MTSAIVGREEELALLGAWLDRASTGAKALVLEGPAGIGKSTLWRAALDLARTRDVRVLSSRPAEAERGYAFAGLGDLFEDAVDGLLPSLPSPRRRALEVALLAEDPLGPVDPRTLGAAVRDGLDLLAADGPLVVAIDDVQWLDRSSAAALAFASRRSQERIALLLTRRLGEGIAPSPLERALDRDVVERMRVGPLSAGALQRLLQHRLDRVLPRPTLLRLHEASGGNPFAALELARALGQDLDPTQPLPVPESLEELVDARLEGLPASTRKALVYVSALGTASLEQLEAVGAPSAALDAALAAGVVEISRGTIRFGHPLLASVLYQGLPAEERRRAHRRLARVLEDPLERARHLALASDRPDAAVAAVLEHAAGLAAARGATGAAAELGEHALRLTPVRAGEDRHRRTIAAGRAQLAAGEAGRARLLAEALETERLHGPPRAEVLLFLAELEPGRLRERIALRRDALAETALEPAAQALMHQRLALETRFTEGLAPALRHARAAVELARQVADDALLAGTLAVLAMLRFMAGKRDALRLAGQAYDLAASADDPQRLVEAAFCRAHVLVWAGELASARSLLESLHRHGSERDERVSAQALWYLSLVELAAGDLAAAADQAERARALGVLYGRDEAEDPQNVFPLALAAARRGELGPARELAEHGLRLADEQAVLLPGFAAVLGAVDLWSGDLAGAADRFAGAERCADLAGWEEPTVRWWRAEHVEALLGLGRVGDALALLDPWEAAGVRLRRRSVLAQATRCRGLVAAAQGDIAGALSLLGQAPARHDEAGDVLGRAQALLALGVVRRRARQKRSAREALEEAAASFERSGAIGWAERARSELGRIGGRRREQGLTPAERRVAALVAEGRTNREVAAALFLGERTVETHLSHIYAKLGVRSRTELARTLGSKP